MRGVLVLLCFAVTGCSLGTMESDEGEPFTPASDQVDSAVADSGQSDTAQADSGAATDTATAPDTTTAADTTPTDPLATLCKGVSGASFDPPSICDASGGNTTTEIPSNNIYSTSWFGCYLKSDGTIYKDPYDNCEFACGNRGLCASTLTGPECEAELKWFAADADRYGCGGRIRVTNCANGKQVVLTTLDRGPNCKSVEKTYGAPVLDMSHPAMTYLFDGKTYGGSDKKRVVVEKVAATTPLGPVE